MATSIQQQAIYDFIKNEKGSLIVQATAGAGKTTTLIGITAQLSKLGYALHDVLMVAFNKAITQELEQKMPLGVKVMTMHSFGRQILADHLLERGQKLDVDGYKYNNMVDAYCKDILKMRYKDKDTRKVKESMTKLINTMRLDLIDKDISLEHLGEILDDTQVEYPEKYQKEICVGAKALLKKGISDAQELKKIDFTDMLYLPWFFKLEPDRKFKIVLVDEAQDTNPLQRWLILAALAPGGRIVAVGDKFQAIYKFAGASSDGMNQLKETTGARELPLSVTWRCPVSHVILAQALIGEENIQPSPAAQPGVVDIISPSQLSDMAKVGDCIMARTNAVLVAQAFELIRQGRRAKIRGRDIGEDLSKLAGSIYNKYIGEDMPWSKVDFYNAVEAWKDGKITEYYRRKDLNEAQRNYQIEQSRDRASILKMIVEENDIHSFFDIKSVLDRLFDDSLGDFILLSTVHKAKGLEFERCFIIAPEKFPMPYGDADEEECILFVALTRAKQELYFVNSVPRHEALEDALIAMLGKNSPGEGKPMKLPVKVPSVTPPANPGIQRSVKPSEITPAPSEPAPLENPQISVTDSHPAQRPTLTPTETMYGTIIPKEGSYYGAVHVGKLGDHKGHDLKVKELLATNTTTTSPESPIPEKRGRGRPRKHPLPEEPAVKRSRGRPRKTAI